MVALSSCFKSLQLHASKAQPCNQGHLPDHFVPWHHKSSYLAQEKNKWPWLGAQQLSKWVPLWDFLLLQTVPSALFVVWNFDGCGSSSFSRVWCWCQHVPTTSARRPLRVFSALSWQRLHCALGKIFPCAFSAPFNTSEILWSCCGWCISSFHKVIFAACALHAMVSSTRFWTSPFSGFAIGMCSKGHFPSSFWISIVWLQGLWGKKPVGVFVGLMIENCPFWRGRRSFECGSARCMQCNVRGSWAYVSWVAVYL